MPVFSIREFKYPDDYDQAVEIWKNSAPGVNFSRSDTPAEIQKKLNYSPDLFLVAVVNELGATTADRLLVYEGINVQP
jgi:hypothetical protein